MKKKIYAIIPARYSSTRLPGKPLLELAAKPIIQHVYERVSLSRYIDEIIVATDDERILQTVKSFGGNAIMTPIEIKSGSDRIAYVAKNLTDAELIVNVQGDEPLISSEVIDGTTKLLMEDAKLLIGTPIKIITESRDIIDPNIVKVVIDKSGYALYFSRSPIPHYRDAENKAEWVRIYKYYKHIGLYVFRRDFLLKFSEMEESYLEKIEKLEQLRVLENGYRIKTFVTDYDSFSIDTPEDFEKLKQTIFKS